MLIDGGVDIDVREHRKTISITKQRKAREIYGIAEGSGEENR